MKDIYGWRGRIGILTPPNYTVFSEWYEVLRQRGIGFVTALLPLEKSTREGFLSLKKAYLSEAKKLVPWEVDVILLGCTAASFIGGRGYDETVIEEIQSETGISTTTTSTCVLQAMRDLRAQRIALIGPYLEEVLQVEVEFFEYHGFTIVYKKAFGYEKVSDFLNMYRYPYMYYSHVKEAWSTVRNSQLDAIFVTCMASPTIRIINVLEKEIGIPVVSSCSASLYVILKYFLKINEPVTEYGKLGQLIEKASLE